MLSPIVEKVLQTLSDVPTLAIAHERLALARDLLEKMEGDNERLRAEVERLKSELDSRPPADFKEHRGVLWRQLPNGTFAPDPYCAVHRTVLTAYNGRMICTLTGCGFKAPFHLGEIKDVHATIAKDT